MPINTKTMPIKMIMSFEKLTFPERPARPSRLTPAKIKGPTRPRAALILNAFSTLLLFKNKKAAAFGTYGWSGEGVKIITEELQKAGFEIINDGIKLMWNPDKEGKQKCIEFGREIGEILNNN